MSLDPAKFPDQDIDALEIEIDRVQHEVGEGLWL